MLKGIGAFHKNNFFFSEIEGVCLKNNLRNSLICEEREKIHKENVIRTSEEIDIAKMNMMVISGHVFLH